MNGYFTDKKEEKQTASTDFTNTSHDPDVDGTNSWNNNVNCSLNNQTTPAFDQTESKAQSNHDSKNNNYSNNVNNSDPNKYIVKIKRKRKSRIRRPSIDLGDAEYKHQSKQAKIKMKNEFNLKDAWNVNNNIEDISYDIGLQQLFQSKYEMIGKLWKYNPNALLKFCMCLFCSLL